MAVVKFMAINMEKPQPKDSFRYEEMTADVPDGNENREGFECQICFSKRYPDCIPGCKTLEFLHTLKKK